MSDITKKYSNGAVTILWQPSKCIHSTVCFRGLPNVFDPRKRPWITPEGVSSERIIEQVKKCPSGALSIVDIAGNQSRTVMENQTNALVEVIANGPLCVHGSISVKDSVGNSVEKLNKTFLCRCGGSSNKPYCDGTHKRNGFVG